MPDDFEYDIFLRHNHADKPRGGGWRANLRRRAKPSNATRLTTMENNA